jgi:hypothetical protein
MMPLLRYARCFVLGCILTAIAASAALAQQPAGPPAEEKSIREQNVYIPYDKLRRVFEKQGRGVFLPYEKFQELWKAARDKTQPPPEVRPPVGAVITEIDNEATAEKDVVRVKAKIKIELLSKGWHEVPLRLADAAIISAKIGAEPARIVGAAGQDYRLLVEKTGKTPEQIELLLEYAKAIQRSPGLNSVSFQTPQAPVSRWKVTIPQPGVKVNFRPLIAATEVPATGDAAEGDSPKGSAKKSGQSPAEQTVVLAFVGAAPMVQIDWTPKAEGAAGLAALASVQADQQVWLSENVVRTRTTLNYAISRAELPQLDIEVPGDYKITNVFDPNVRLWNVKAQDGKQKITVQFFEPAKQAQQIVVELEQYFGEKTKTVAMPVVRALNVVRQQGVVVVQPSAGLRCEVEKSGGLLQVDASELPPALVQGGWAFAYRYATVPYELAFDVEKEQPRILADSLVESYLEPEKLTLDFLTIYTIERAGVFRLELDVPEGFDVRRVAGQDIAGVQAVQVDNYHREGEKQTRLVVSLSRKALGRVALWVELATDLKQPELLAPLGKTAKLEWAIPQVAPRSVERATGRLLVYAPDSLRVINPGGTAGLRNIAPQEALQNIVSPRPQKPDNVKPLLAFAYGQEPTGLTLMAERKKPQVNVEQQLIVKIDEGIAKYEAVFRYQVDYSGIKSLRIDLPESVAKIAHTKTAHEVIAPPPGDLPKGYVAWSLRGEGELLGKGEFAISWEDKVKQEEKGKDLSDNSPHPNPLPAGEENSGSTSGKKVPLPIPRLIPQGVDIASGQIALVKSETLDLSESGQPKGLTPIDPQSNLTPPVPGAARAYKFSGPWELTVAAIQYQLEEVKRTSLERGVVRMVVTSADTVAVQALYRVRTARDRLKLKLPPKAQFDADPLRLNGKSVPLELSPTKGEYVVPIMAPNADTPFLLELRYTLSSDGSRLGLPVFTQEEELAVLQVYVEVYLPETTALLGVSGPWSQEFFWFPERYYLAWHPYPNRTVPVNLLQWVVEGVNVPGDSIANFPIDGTCYVFSSLQPEAPPEGALILRMMNASWLKACLFLAVTVLGLALIPAPLCAKVLYMGATVAALVLLAVFSPTLAFQVLNVIFAAAWAVVAVLWIVWCVARWSRGMCRSALLASPPAHEAGVDLSQYEPNPPEPPHAEENPQSPGTEGGPSHE